MRAIWKGSISFGLVNIPIRLYSAVESSSLSFDLVDPTDMGKVRYKRVNENTGKEVEYGQIAKAYMYNGEYVLLEDDDFEAASPEKTKIIEVNHFIDEKEVDTIFFEKSYYVEPEKQGEKAYALLREALKKSGKVGVAQFVLRTAETLTVLKPKDDVLVLSKIRFAEEVRDTSELKLPPKTAVKSEELKMAITLINQYSKKFEIEKYKNEYSNALMKVIEARASGKKAKVHKLKPKEDTHAQNLMDMLKASLAAS
jgi:DNA end-binding protein Ku